jgi:hypothetical protein
MSKSKPNPSDWSDEEVEALLERLEEHVDTDTELGQAVRSRRRDVLKAIGAVGAGGLAGAAGMEAATGDARAGTQQAGTIGTSSSPVDIEAEDITTDTVTTDALNNGVSGRVGDTVYFDPDDTGPYTDAQDALDDAPAGGALLLAAKEIDVAQQGTLSTTRGVSIRGTGHYGTSSGASEGTFLVNTGSDTVDSPVIEIAPSGRESWATVRNLRVRHQGDTTAAIRFDNMTRAVARDVSVSCQDQGDRGIAWDGDSFHSFAVNVVAQGATTAGLDYQGSGSDNYFIRCKTNCTGTTGAVGARLGKTAYIIAGQHEGDAAAIQFDNQTGSDQIQGGVYQPVIEASTPAIDVTGGNDWEGLHLVEPYVAPTTGVDTAVRFDRADNSILHFPTVNGSSSTLVEFTSNANRCGVVGTHGALAGSGFTNNGTQSWLQVPQLINEFPITQLPTDTYVSVAGNASKNGSPTWYDLGNAEWNYASSAGTF